MAAETYRRYLAVRSAEQRLEPYNATLGMVWLDMDTKVHRERLPSDLKNIEDGSIPFIWRYPEVRVDVDQGIFNRSLPEHLRDGYRWMMSSDKQIEYDKHMQLAREEFIRDFLEKYPDTILVRDGGVSGLYWEPLEGVGVNLKVGQAMCERVLVREEIEEVPDPEALDEIVREATKDVPKVKRVKPVYEWRCNDAEFEKS